MSPVIVILHRSRKKREHCHAALQKILLKLYCHVVAFYSEEVIDPAGVISESVIGVEVYSDVGRDEPPLLNDRQFEPAIPVNSLCFILKILGKVNYLHNR